MGTSGVISGARCALYAVLHKRGGAAGGAASRAWEIHGGVPVSTQARSIDDNSARLGAGIWWTAGVAIRRWFVRIDDNIDYHHFLVLSPPHASLPEVPCPAVRVTNHRH